MKNVLFALLLIAVPALCAAEREHGSLEQFSLTDLRVVSVSKPRCDGTRFAYVRDPKGYLHHLEAGEYVGKSEGRVSKIKRDAVLVVELVQSSAGAWTERNAEMKLTQHRDPTDVE